MSTTDTHTAPMTVRSMALLVLISVVFFVLVRQSVGIPESGDLRALWFAGKYYSSQEIGHVYRIYEDVFSMAPPDIWAQDVLDQGLETPVYPFIYPPIWAWVMSMLVPLTTMDELARIMGIINPCLTILSALLAMRIAAPRMPRPFYYAVALSVAYLSLAFLLPLAENQPQILVAFLILLGIERTQNGSPVFGGISMALAASIKLYPVIFALIWYAAGQRRATYSVAMFGGLLGLASIAVAGWPMHAAFLSELSAISKTALVSRANFSLDPFVAALTFSESQMSAGNTYATGGETNWSYIAKGPTWLLVSAFVQVCTLAVLLVLAHRTKMQNPLLWPFSIIALAFVSPLSWMYHYTAALLFLPSLLDKLGTRHGLILVFLITLPTHLWLYSIGFLGNVDRLVTVVWTNGAIILAGAVFLWLALRENDELGRVR